MHTEILIPHVMASGGGGWEGGQVTGIESLSEFFLESGSNEYTHWVIYEAETHFLRVQ